jgi:heterotetrameric sarcosine oxidase gamma subunit
MTTGGRGSTSDESTAGRATSGEERLAPTAAGPLRSAVPLGWSPESIVLGGWLVSDRATESTLRLVDCSAVGKVVLQAGPAGSLAGLLSVPPGRAELFEDGLLVSSVAPGEWLLLIPGPRPSVVDRLVDEASRGSDGEAGDEVVSVVDVTHGRTALRLTGRAAAEVLGALSALDLSDRAFPHGSVGAAAVAGVRTVVIRDDLFADEAGVDRVLEPEAAAEDGARAGAEVRSYLLVCDRSAGRHLHERLLDAGRPWGAAPEGYARYRSRRVDV